MPSAADPTPEESATATEPAKAATGAPDDVRERFRAALEHKHNGGPGAGAGAGGSKAGAATTNHKVQRTFRRRAGG